MRIKYNLFVKLLYLFIMILLGQSDLYAKRSIEVTSEQINIALRKVGHQLLLISGDSTSAILPVQIIDDDKYMLQLDVPIYYDTLPGLLHTSLIDIGAIDDYYVTISSCDSDTILLGFDRDDYEQGLIPCLGREYNETCNVVTLSLASNQGNSRPVGPYFIIGIFLIGGIILLTKYKSRDEVLTQQKDDLDEEIIVLGDTTIHIRNQTLKTPKTVETLTYREQKLLVYLASHKNEILAREKIVSEVWGDEGVMVSRSLDVFISRLRKLLKHDPKVQIKNIHGVGYRLEIQAN